MYEDLKIILYPDPRLKKFSQPIERFDADLVALTQRMFELMRESRGVGLAAPQVGKNIRLFVVNHSGKPEDDRVYINPELSDAEGEELSDEGCLSLPGITVEVARAKTARMKARDVSGNAVDQLETGYIARIWQHELDHLNGTLLIDRMGPSAKMENRKKLKEMEETYLEEHPPKPKSKSR